MANNMVAHRSLSSNAVLRRTGGQNDHRNIRDRQTMHRTIIKQGYLKKLPNAARLGASLKKVERRWFVFGIIGRTDPYLEYYENEESIFGSRPLNIVFLDTCHHITRNQKTTRFCNIFTLVLKDRLLSLVAPTREAMFEWSRAIEERLCSLGIIESSHGPGHNDYIRMPFLQRHSFHELATHGHNQEPQGHNQERVYLDVQASGGSFPLVRAAEPELIPPSRDRSTAEPFYENFPRTQEAEGLMEDTYFLTNSSKCDEDVYVAAAPEESENVYANSARLKIADDEADLLNLRSADTQPDVRRSSVSDLVAVEHDSGASPENFPAAPPLAERQSSVVSNETSRLSASMRNSLLDVIPTGSSGENHEMNPVALPSYDEALSSPNPLNEDFIQYCRLRPLSVALPPVSYSRVTPRSSVAEPLSSNVAAMSSRADGHGLTLPPPYSSRKTLSVGANVPLKEAQLQKLVQEMNDARGISVVIPMAQCQGTIAFVECFNQIWIGGWNQRLCPTFHSFLHIGDQLISVNDVTPNSAQMAKKLVKACAGKMNATLTIRRIPSGRAFGLSRASGGSSNSLGLTMVNKTAEIGLVDPTGLARENGLEEKAPAMNGEGGEGGSWWITEVNNQPLNLFFKDDEAKQRLNAVGSHISFVVQPTQLVAEIKKQLKNSKGFRDFLVN